MDNLIEGQYRQGDVLLVKRTDAIAKEDSVEPLENGATVLMHGEVTGHRHAFYQPGAVVVNTPKTRALKLVSTQALLHEEHTAMLPTIGDYDLPAQTEWTDDDEPIAVKD